MISRITEIATLTFAAPIAWKNTGVIRENTAEKKRIECAIMIKAAEEEQKNEEE